jgi:hypothetical protein
MCSNPSVNYEGENHGAPTPYSSLSRLPTLTARVPPGQSLALYQLYKASNGGEERRAVQDVHYQATAWAAPSYMGQPTNPGLEPFSRLGQSPAESVEKLEPDYGTAFLRNPGARTANDGFITPTTPWNQWEGWSFY